MTQSEKIEFGMEIIAGMKASAYHASIEDGREMVLEDMDIEVIKTRVHEQAIFIADVALNKLKHLTTSSSGSSTTA